jgi:DNA-binding MarR family transcriptional regulator
MIQCDYNHGVDRAVERGELLAESVGFMLSKLGFHTAGGFAQALAPLGIEPRQFGLLRYIDAAEGSSQHALGTAMHIPPSAMVAIIDDLEGRGLVERRPNPHDRRAHALHLTAKGRRLYDKAVDIAVAYEDGLCASLTPAEKEQLLGLLQRLAADQSSPIGVHQGMMPRQH